MNTIKEFIGGILLVVGMGVLAGLFIGVTIIVTEAVINF